MIEYLNIKSISVKELHDLQSRRSIQLIDVRTPEEFQYVHAAGARNMPLDTFDPQALSIEIRAEDPPMYFICEVGVRSAHACAIMMAAGTKNVVNVEGGTQAWAVAELPIEHGE